MIMLIYIMILIYLSHQSYEKSSKLSWKIVLYVAKFLNKTQLVVVESYDDAHLLNKYLRKLAHFFLFFILSILIYFYYFNYKCSVFVLISPLLLAFIDEKTKILIKNRHYDFNEFLINIYGVCAGYTVCLLFTIIL